MELSTKARKLVQIFIPKKPGVRIRKNKKYTQRTCLQEREGFKKPRGHTYPLVEWSEFSGNTLENLLSHKSAQERSDGTERTLCHVSQFTKQPCVDLVYLATISRFGIDVSCDIKEVLRVCIIPGARETLVLFHEGVDGQVANVELRGSRELGKVNRQKIWLLKRFA
jgi:hypothetical protein